MPRYVYASHARGCGAVVEHSSEPRGFGRRIRVAVYKRLTGSLARTHTGTGGRAFDRDFQVLAKKDQS